MLKTAEETALNSPPEIDTRSFMWMFGRLDEDHELEHFFSNLPSFRSSKVVDDPLAILPEEGKRMIFEALIGLLDRTLSSDLLPEPVKRRRAIVCATALDPSDFPSAYDILFQFVNGDQHRGLQTAEFGHIVRRWGNSGNQRTALLAQATVSSILARAQRHDDSWFLLASSELGVPESVLRDYATHGDSLSLARLIHITRQQFSHFRKGPWPGFEFLKVLEASSKFNVHDTSPELQHKFCALWNQIVLEVQNDDDRSMTLEILGRIRSVYVDLHQDTDSAPTRFSPSTRDNDVILSRPPSYPVCNVASHFHDDSASTSFVRTVLHHNAALVPVSLSGLDAPSAYVSNLLYVDESLTGTAVPPLDSFHPAHQTTLESLRIPVTSPDPATAGAIRDIVTSGITTPHPTPETSTSVPPLSSAAALQHNAGRRTSSDVLDVPSLPSPTPVLDEMFPTGPRSSSDSPVTGSDLASFSPESHSSMLAPAAPGPSPQATSAPDLGAAAEGEGGTKAASHKERDALDPPSASRANILAAPDLPPQSPSSVTDVAIPGPSWFSLGAEHTGDHSSRGQYDIV